MKILDMCDIGPFPDYPQTTVDKVASVIELDFTWLIVCLSANILIYLLILLSPLSSLLILLSPLSPLLLLISKKFAVMNPK